MWQLAVGLLTLLALGPSLALVPDTGVIEISVEEVSCNSSRPIFQCNQTQCILETSLCNGIPECGNGRDESVAMCESLSEGNKSTTTTTTRPPPPPQPPPPPPPQPQRPPPNLQP
ncbi:hypothetical protein M8J76_005896 [Diaphorina citri]|nr:hypothetical protein M8J76_005896 [Diaphorina citri]